MEITDVNVHIMRRKGVIRGVASITIDGCFVVRDIKILSGSEGLFIAMPSRKLPDGTYKDIAHPINKETRMKIQDKVFEKYEEVCKQEEELDENSNGETFNNDNNNDN